MSAVGTIFSKEVKDNLRDRRSIFSAFSSSLIGPIILLLLIVILGKSVFTDARENPLQISIIGAENAPNLVSYLEQNGSELVPGPDDAEQAVRNGDLDFVLIIPETYAEQFTSGNPASIRVVMDSSRQSAMSNVERMRSLLEGYNTYLGSMRLMARGINPAVTNPLAIERADVATPQTQALIFLNMMPYFIILVVFVGGMYVIIDTTAGERERDSLEPLLTNPVPRWQFVLGKLFAAIPFAVAALLLNLIAFFIAFNVFPIEDYVGIQISLDPIALWNIFLLSLPMILLASALQMIIATFTRSFKEAQTYVSFLPLIPALPGIGLAFLPIKPTLVTMMIPTFGQQMLINQFMRAEPVNPTFLIVNTVVTLLVSVVLIWVAVKLYERENIIFGAR